MEHLPATEYSKNFPWSLRNRISFRDILRDVTIGFADGLTVPFALTAGLSSLGSSRLVVIAGLAELFSGSISMGLGAFLAAESEREQYEAKERYEKDRASRYPGDEDDAIYLMMRTYGLDRDTLTPVIEHFDRQPEQRVKFVLDIKFQISHRSYAAAWISSLSMGLSYLLGGLIPLIPYFAFSSVNDALFTSIGATAIALCISGVGKSVLAGLNRRLVAMGALKTLLAGTAAAAASYGIVRAVNISDLGRNRTR